MFENFHHANGIGHSTADGVIGIYQKDCSVREGASIGEEGGELAWVGIFFIFCFSLIQECINIDMLPLIKLRMLVGKTLYKRVGHGSGHRNPMFHTGQGIRSEEHTSELQSRENLVCRLLLEKKKQF